MFVENAETKYIESMFLNVLFQALMGRFQLQSKLKLPLFSRFILVPINWY